MDPDAPADVREGMGKRSLDPRLVARGYRVTTIDVHVGLPRHGMPVRTSRKVYQLVGPSGRVLDHSPRLATLVESAVRVAEENGEVLDPV